MRPRNNAFVSSKARVWPTNNVFSNAIACDYKVDVTSVFGWVVFVYYFSMCM